MLKVTQYCKQHTYCKYHNIVNQTILQLKKISREEAIKKWMSLTDGEK